MDKFVIIIVLLIFPLLGYEYLSLLDESTFLLYCVFELLTAFFFFYFWRTDIRKSLIVVYFFITWFIYNSFGVFRCAVIKEFNSDNLNEAIYILIFSTISLGLGILLTGKIKVKQYKSINKFNPNKYTFYIFSIAYLLFNLYIFSLSGGFVNYFYSDYQSKVPDNLKTLIFILSGVFSYFRFFNIGFLFNRTEKSPNIYIVYLSLFFSAIAVFSSGASLGLFSLMLSIFLFKYCLPQSLTEKKSLVKYIYSSVGLGLILGILVRFNRNDYSSFSTKVFTSLGKEILLSPTFDSIGNLIKVMTYLKPLYLPNQIIYPFVNALPRTIFPWKPMELGRIISYKFYGFSENQIGGFAPSPMGEFYYDFGIFGVFFGMFFLGIFLGIIQKKMNNSPDTTWKWILLVTISLLTGTLPAWYTGFGIRLFYLVVFIGLVKCVDFLVKKKG